jgi:8-oxo-dGTP diphosphatase
MKTMERVSEPPPAEGESSTVHIETERLLLRHLQLEDAPAVQHLVGDWEIARFTGAIPHPYPDGAAAKWIAGLGDDDERVFAVTRREDGTFLGCIGLRPRQDQREAVFGYWIGKPFWGRGYAAEALRALVDHAFQAYDIDRVRASAVPENRASIRVQEKVGLAYVGIADEVAPARGGSMGVEVRALSRRRWQELKEPPPVPVVVVVAVLLVDGDGRVLIAQRPQGKSMAGLWEFPGGKMKNGEAPEAALIRELKEELAIDIQAACLAPFSFASHRYDSFHLLMPLYVCRRWDGSVQPQEGQMVKWVKPAKLADYPMPPADKPLVAMIRDYL